MLSDVRCRWQIAAEETAGAASGESEESNLVLVYRLQAESFREDFDRERQDHQRTKAQVDSLALQWKALHDELRRCATEVRYSAAVGGFAGSMGAIAPPPPAPVRRPEKIFLNEK